MSDVSKQRILIMEGNPRERRERTLELGIRTSSAIYAEAIHAHFPELDIDVIYGADPDASLPENRKLSDYAGFVVSGSALHAYDTDFAVTNQIDILRQAANVGLPILGSCWGLQIAAVAAGGEVSYHPKGREVGIGRTIIVNPAGRAHPMLRARGAAFDAPCIHYDEVTRLPDTATLLASNAHSNVQAAIIPLGKTKIWAVQYHPEFDLRHLADLYALYADDMIAQGFFANKVVLERYCNDVMTLHKEPDNFGLAWQLGVDEAIINDTDRRSEIIAWVASEVYGREAMKGLNGQRPSAK